MMTTGECQNQLLLAIALILVAHLFDKWATEPAKSPRNSFHSFGMFVACAFGLWLVFSNFEQVMRLGK